MGILDDAIKEHLELKKAHGADQGELKQEIDAVLGEPGAVDASAVENAAALEERAEVPEPAEPPAPPTPTPEPVTEAPEPEQPPARPIPTPEPTAGHTPSAADFNWKSESRVEAESAKHKDRSAEEVSLPSSGGETGDLLEATPDFFQETPEYDRLWFEEKAPKDFNFDS